MEQLNPNSPDARLRKLYDDILAYLSRVGGFVWETPRSPRGGPPINLVLDGDYYGFFPFIMEHKGRPPLSKFEQEAVKKMNDVGARVFCISSLSRLEEIMRTDLIKEEMNRALPRATVIRMLESWGRGDPAPRELQDAIDGLQYDYRRVIHKVYFDRLTMNKIALNDRVAPAVVFNRHSRAVRSIRNKLLSDPAFEGVLKED